MNVSQSITVSFFSRGLLTVIAAAALAGFSARAGLTLQMQVFQYGSHNNYTYYFDPQLGTNSSGANVSFGDYYVTSPGIPTNGSSSFWHYDANGFNQTDGFRNSYGDFNSMVHELTNGNWSLFITNATITNVYHFSVQVNLNSNSLPKVQITPAYGAVDVSNQPTFTWQGPANYSSLTVSEFNTSQILPVSQTSWFSSRVLNDGPNYFSVNYVSNSTTVVVASVPTNRLSQTFSGWISSNLLSVSYESDFSVGLPNTAGSFHALIAHYPFNAASGSVLNAATDTSGNGYNLSFGGSFGSQGGENMTADSAAGAGAVQFHDGDNNSGGYLGWTNPTPPTLLSTLARSFSISCWIKTTQNIAWNTAPAYYGAGIVSADVGGLANDLVPIALTGGSIAFNTGGPTEDVTLNSIANVNDGNYHHIVVTRDQPTGKKIIYIDGIFDSFASGTTNLLSDPLKLTIGALANAGNADPNDGSYSQGFDGELDDLQIYSGVLSANEVANLYAYPGTTIANGASPVGGHTGIARYAFDNSGFLGQDYSTNQNDIYCGSGWGTNDLTQPPHQFTNDAVAGGGAVKFFGYDSMVPCGQAFDSWSNTFGGSFTVSAWIKTTNVIGNDADSLSDLSGNGKQAVIYLNNSWNNSGGVLPLGITGSKAASFTGDVNYIGDTLHSTHSVTTGSYVHVVVTRDQANGQKSIYFNGVLDAVSYGRPGPLNGLPSYASIGGSTGNAYQGNVDDVQIYSGVLNSNEVAYLYSHPGLMATNVAANLINPINDALGTSNLNWVTAGDSNWFVETATTYNGSPFAMQSGSVTNGQISTLSVTVTGPGTVTFYWLSVASDPNNGFNYDFEIDGNSQTSLAGNAGWYQEGPFTIGSGTHTLSWTTSANGDTDPTQAGFLDQVSFVPTSTNFAPVITVNPLNQTNYPGYSVALFAAATSNPTATWQWFKVGGALPIAYATNGLFIPTNSGTAGVAGNYYAIASNLLGTALTTTATVSFVSAPLPPSWSQAFKSPFVPVVDSTATKDYYYGSLVDTNGNLYVAAEFGGNTLVGTSNLNSGTGGDAAAIVKQSPTGAPLWAVGITNNGNGNSYGECVAAAPGGGIYLAGNYSGNNWLGTNKLTDAGNGDIFLARFNANGSNVWVRTFGGTNTDFMVINSLAANPAGNVTVAGLLGGGPVTIGTSNYVVTGQQGILFQVNSTGTVQWSQLLPAEFVQYLTYSAGRLYASVNTETSGGTTNMVIGGVSNLTDRAWAVACLNDTNGQAIWLRGVGAPSGGGQNNPYASGLIDDVPRLAVSGTNVFMTGAAYGSSASFGAITVNFGSLRGQYFARYDTNGNAQVATTYGSVTTTPIAAVADARGNVYVSGDFDGFAWFGNDVIAAPVATRPYAGDFSQAFVAKFDSNGNPLWAQAAVAAVTVNFLGIALASDGVWVSGWCNSGVYPQIGPTVFGTNLVWSDAQWLYGGAGGSTSVIYYPGGVLAKITDGATTAMPVTLLNPQDSGVNFQFQFQSQSGFTNAVQFRTNLIAGLNWQTCSNVVGDGSLKTISIPLSLFSPAKQGFIRVATQ